MITSPKNKVITHGEVKECLSESDSNNKKVPGFKHLGSELIVVELVSGCRLVLCAKKKKATPARCFHSVHHSKIKVDGSKTTVKRFVGSVVPGKTTVTTRGATFDRENVGLHAKCVLFVAAVPGLQSWLCSDYENYEDIDLLR